MPEPRGNGMKRTILMLLTALIAGARADEWTSVLKITMDPPDSSQQILNICFTPAKAAVYDQLIFDCIYHQEYPWVDLSGKTVTRVIEPVVFTYRRLAVKMVAELDCHTSFRAPVGFKRLNETFGEKTFATNAPVFIDRLRITGEVNGEALWRHELKVPGCYTNPAPRAATPPPPPPKGRFGEVNLD